MFLDFFIKLKDSKIPVSLNEYLTFLNALKFDLVGYNINKFYYLARSILVKDEKLLDKFDVVFGQYFKSIEKIKHKDLLQLFEIPDNWLKEIRDKQNGKTRN